MSSETGTSLFAKAFGVVAGAGFAVVSVVGALTVVVVGVPLAACVVFCAGLLGLSAGVESQMSDARISHEARLAAECVKLGKPSDCWIAENEACVQQGRTSFCWLPGERLPDAPQ